MIENKGATMLENGFKLFDPLGKKDASIQKSKNFNDIILFVVEGGSYSEYSDICEFSKKTGRNIIYGSTDILNAKDLINELIK